EIVSVMLSGKDKVSVEVLMHCLLTPKEILNISSRWEIFKMLSEGVSQRKIAGNLGVSLCKVTRGSREMKKHREVILEMMERLKEIEGKK
ncbi:MAG: trp operon repressor, partial [Leptospirales bacterium]|nr:trp operon repressor [Leptospirales bacterium]